MPRKRRLEEPVLRTPRQILGVRSQLVAALRACDNGAYVELDLRSAKNLLEVLDQGLALIRAQDELERRIAHGLEITFAGGGAYANDP